MAARGTASGRHDLCFTTITRLIYYEGGDKVEGTTQVELEHVRGTSGQREVVGVQPKYATWKNIEWVNLAHIP